MSRRRFELPPLDLLQAFEAAARLGSFTRAADELALTQSAVSRQIAALEEHFGRPLFQRLHRGLQLNEAGHQLQRTVADVLQQLHAAGAVLRGAGRPKAVIVTTTPGFAGLWLIPRLARFTATRPDVDVRISASYALVNLDRDGVDVAVRYQSEHGAGPEGLRLFGEEALPVCSPQLQRDRTRPLRRPEDLRQHCLLHTDSGSGNQVLEWPPWLAAMGLPDLKPASVLHFSQYDQMIQAALAGQGVALGKLPLLNDLLAQRKLVAPFKTRVASARSYYVFQSAASRDKPEVREFVAWLVAEAAAAG
jgi:LysR family transcriptional regulator, glycine cleavage system transcriptional activator